MGQIFAPTAIEITATDRHLTGEGSEDVEYVNLPIFRSFWCGNGLSTSLGIWTLVGRRCMTSDLLIMASALSSLALITRSSFSFLGRLHNPVFNLVQSFRERCGCVSNTQKNAKISILFVFLLF
jgi:hypothetical protein